MNIKRCLVALVLLVAIADSNRADIYRWDTGEVILGTEGITPGPGVQLASFPLQYAALGGFTLSDANFRFADLTRATLVQSVLTNADLTGAKISGLNCGCSELDSPNNLTAAQLYSTDSYKAKDLNGIGLCAHDLSGVDFRSQNLSNARFRRATLTGADLTDATITGATFLNTTGLGRGPFGVGFTKEQLYSTASFKQRSLSGVDLTQNDLSGWDFAGQDLTEAAIRFSLTSNADFTDANVTGTDFSGSDIAKEQIYATTNYKQRNLQGNKLLNMNLSHWNLAAQNLSDADLSFSLLTDADLSGAIVAGTRFRNTTGFMSGSGGGFSKEQLYSTASYELKDLRGIGLEDNDLSLWNFSGQSLDRSNFWRAKLNSANFTGANLASANFQDATLTNAVLTGADLRGANGWSGDGLLGNTIEPDGVIRGLGVVGQQLVRIRDDDGVPDPAPAYWLSPRDPIPIHVQQAFHQDGGTLELVFEFDPWDSLISFEPGIPVELGGTLDLTFAEDVDVASQVGRTLRIFDWSGVNPTGQFQVVSSYKWDLTNLYTTGEVTLTAVPEPSSFVLSTCGIVAVRFARGRRRTVR